MLRGKEITMESDDDGRVRGSSLSWRKALVFFVIVGVAGWIGVAGLIYASTVAWDIVAGRSDAPQNVAPAAGPGR